LKSGSWANFWRQTTSKVSTSKLKIIRHEPSSRGNMPKLYDEFSPSHDQESWSSEVQGVAWVHDDFSNLFLHRFRLNLR
jgi:hypothetical protein